MTTTMKKRLATAIVAAAFTAPASADDSRWIAVQYHDRSEVDLSIGSGVVTEITLHRGEVLRGGEFVGETLDAGAGGGQYQLWSYKSFYSGMGAQQTPHLTFVPSQAGLDANAVIATTEHVYRLRLLSTSSTRPTYVQVVYPGPPARPHPRIARSTPKPVDPPSTAAQMEAACASMPKNERYGSDPQPAAWRPVRVCHSTSRTFVQLAPSVTVPVDVPVPKQVTSSGDQSVVWTYDSGLRIYGIDLVADEFVLTLRQGKKTMRMRVQRQVVATPVARSRAPRAAVAAVPSPAIASSSPSPDAALTSILGGGRG